METFETKMKDLMEFVQDVAHGLYYMGQTEICARYPVDGKSVKIDIKLEVENEAFEKRDV